MAVISDKEHLMPVRTRHYTQHDAESDPYLFWLSVMTNSELSLVQKMMILMPHGITTSEAPGVIA